MILTDRQMSLRAFTASDLSGVIRLVRELSEPRADGLSTTAAIVEKISGLTRAENACVYESRGPWRGEMTELYRHDWRDWQTERLSASMNGRRLSSVTSGCTEMTWPPPERNPRKLIRWYCIASCLPAGRDYFLTFAFARRAQPFSGREKILVRSLHESGALDSVSPHRTHYKRVVLSPRIREVLAGLRSGQSEKQIAAQLALSRHTVHAYVKSLYRSYKVNSRGELLSLSIAPSEKTAAFQ